jgi:diadenosine tetraphosphatase ApaH/serine/threonine PP2A family protein phosphatase
MNAFVEHHKDSIKFSYGCFDRLLLNGCIQSFLDGARAQGFFWVYRKTYPVSRMVLREVANQYHNWVAHSAQKWGAEIVDAPKGRRDEFVEPYFRNAQPDQVVVIIKAREPAGIMTAIGAADKWHLETKYRWIKQYNFYLRDAEWGPMFVRVCPYFSFSTRICLNQHHWLAHKMKQAGLHFVQTKNAFRQCSDPAALQKMANSLTADDLTKCGRKWISRLIPFFQAKERREAGCWHQLFFAQAEYCENLIFRQRAALDELGERLLDANRNLGRPDKLTVIFGRRIHKHYQGKLQTEIEDMHLGNPVMRSCYKNGFAKHYVRDHDVLRIETATNNVYEDYGVRKAVENLVPLREKLQGITTRYQEVQQDILETFLDRGELRSLGQPTVLSNSKRVPGLKLDHPRQLALMSALVRFSHVTAGDTFTTSELQVGVAEALDIPADKCPLGSVRYELWKLRAKGLVDKLPHSRRYKLLPNGYRICLLFLKLFDKIYAPLVAGLLHPFRGDRLLSEARLTQLDRLYQSIVVALDQLTAAVGLKIAA